MNLEVGDYLSIFGLSRVAVKDLKISYYHMSYSLNSLKGGLYRGLYRALLWGLLRGILGV